MRIKYLRALEKFANRAISTLKKEDFDRQKFQERMYKNQKILQRCEIIVLHSNYTKSLEQFVHACLDFTKQKKELLSLANNLDRLKKAKRREKYKHDVKEYYDQYIF